MKHLLDKLATKPCWASALRAAGCLRASLSLAFVIMLISGSPQPASAQEKTFARSQQLPSAEKVIENYLNALGGKKRVAAIRDATYEWTIKLKEQLMGIARMQTKTPASVRTEMTFGNGQVISAANPRSAWTRGLDGKLHNLTDAEAAAARLQAVLDASHFVDLKKSNILARLVSVKDVAGNPAYVVEFSMRNGSRLRYLFSTTTRLLVSIEDDARKTTTRFEDYRSEGNILEPHRMRLNTGGTGELIFLLQRATYNTGISDTIFDPPRGAGSNGTITSITLRPYRTEIPNFWA